MLAQELIRKKRDGLSLTSSELDWFVKRLTSGYISEGQAAAFAMATYFNGMSLEERVAFTMSMRDSGEVIDWQSTGPIIDKHSTGGIGDNVSLLLAPALAACGGYVPMVSGRGLGHTGGTLDKFDSIPGYNTQPDLDTFKRAVKSTGCAIVGQTPKVAPADKILYSIRDVTATVESIDLITASILSKKLSANLDALVLDIKCGNGAFMTSHRDAKTLAESLVSVSNLLGCKTIALLTDMNEPLASSVGNSLEVMNAVEFLSGKKRDQRLFNVVCSLGAELLVLMDLVENRSSGFAKIKNSFDSGSSAEIFSKMIAVLGGPSNFLDKASSILPRATIVEDVYAPQSGTVSAVDTRSLGISVVELGGGRRTVKDKIDYSVGFDNLLSIGDKADKNIPIGRIHANDWEKFEEAKSRMIRAYKIDDQKIKKCDLIIDYVK
ncbi:MAG: thymidine phosphorylase [Pseudomonadota bacterium]|nr:thymidine phosphorylase [Pseudomonadota bacterium]